jgi:hypothetical protein
MGERFMDTDRDTFSVDGQVVDDAKRVVETVERVTPFPASLRDVPSRDVDTFIG